MASYISIINNRRIGPSSLGVPGWVVGAYKPTKYAWGWVDPSYYRLVHGTNTYSVEFTDIGGNIYASKTISFEI